MITGKMVAEAEKNGITIARLRQRLNRGWAVDRAITEPPTKLKERGRWLKIAKENGIREKLFDYRVYYLGWSWERAASEPKGPRGRKPKNGIQCKWGSHQNTRKNEKRSKSIEV